MFELVAHPISWMGQLSACVSVPFSVREEYSMECTPERLLSPPYIAIAIEDAGSRESDVLHAIVGCVLWCTCHSLCTH